MNNNNTEHTKKINELQKSQWGQYDYQEILEAMTTLDKKLLKEIEQLKKLLKEIQQLQNQN